MSSELPDPVAIAVAFTRILEGLRIQYVIGGSLASSVHGEPRATNDVDVVADLRPERVDAFVEAVSPEYYVSPRAVRSAVRSGGSFNVIQADAAIKVDIFVAGDDPFEAERLAHRLEAELSEGTSVYVDTAEHTVLRKLEWYRRGGEVSDRQWRDVVTILRVQGRRLDEARMREWAEKLRVSDLLARASAEVLQG